MSQFQNSDDYRRYKLTKELKDKIEFINDFTDIQDLEVYCDLCDRKLEPWEHEKLICPVCHIISSPTFTILKHKPTREGPVDEDVIDGNDITNVSEHYQFKTRKEEEDSFINSLKSQGYTIISSTKK